MATNYSAWTAIKNSLRFNPAKLLVVYDNNGQQVNAGGYKYDDQVLLQYDALLNIAPRRDYEHVFVKGHNGMLYNVVTNIKWSENQRWNPLFWYL